MLVVIAGTARTIANKAMPQPRFEILAGMIDGVNQVFTTSVAFTPSSTAVFLNGQLKRPHVSGVQDGWTETDPAAGVVTLDEAPRVGDVVQAFYLDTSPPPVVVVTEPEPLEATVSDVDHLDALVDDSDGVDATLADVVGLAAEVDDVDEVDAVVDDVQEFEATLEVSL